MARKMLDILSKILLSAFLAAVLGALAVLTVVPRMVDGAALTVLTGSMSPEIPAGSVAVIRPVDPGTLQVGDVITFQTAPGEATYITHRIEQIHLDTTPVTLTTKGDANRGADVDPVPVTAVRGEVMFSVPYLGAVKNAISTGGIGLLAVVAALVGYALTQVVSFLREQRRAAAGPAAAAQAEASGDGKVSDEEKVLDGAT